ncbi:MAG TPA: carboxyl transferase domain-containing protein, partial [Thermoanaerobaculia bacterium]|nr:carboxyl transferase domain-containing protein [Thermoanaerobaculia bacterium]
MARPALHPIGRARAAAVDDRTFARNLEAMRERETTLLARRAEVASGWGEEYVARVHARGKLTARERIQRLIDPDSRVHEVGTFANWGERFGKLTSPAAGVVTAFCRIEDRWAMVIANDNTV